MTLPVGARVMMHYGSANRDEAHFGDADDYDPRRENVGKHRLRQGHHFCIGAPLARLELRVALPLLLERLPNLRLAHDRDVVHEPIFFARGLASLWLEWDGYPDRRRHHEGTARRASRRGGARVRGGRDRGAQAAEINYATSFGNFGRDAYVYVAIEKGTSATRASSSKVTSGTGSVDNIKLAAAGRLDYTPVDIGALMVTRANEGLPVKTVAVVHQNTMSAIFRSRRRASPSQGTRRSPLAARPPRRCGSSSRSTRRRRGSTRRRSRGATRCRRRSPPCWPRSRWTGSDSSPSACRSCRGRPASRCRPSSTRSSCCGLLGIGVVASDEKIRTKPAEVRSFTRALLKGLRYALDNPGEAGYILKKYQPLADPIVAAQELRIMKFFAENKTTRTKATGSATSTAARWPRPRA